MQRFKENLNIMFVQPYNGKKQPKQQNEKNHNLW